MRLLILIFFISSAFASTPAPKYPEVICNQCKLPMRETISRFVCTDNHMSIKKSDFLKNEDGNYYLPTTEKKTYNKSASRSLSRAGDHLQDYVFYTIAGNLLVMVGNYITAISIDEEKSTMTGIALSAVGGAISLGSFLKVGQAGKELENASKAIKTLESKND